MVHAVENSSSLLPEGFEQGALSMSVSLEDRSRKIRARMQSLRSDLSQDAARIARSKNELLNWKDYVKKFPAGTLLFGAIIGFLFVPGRKVIKSVKLTEGSIKNLVEKQNLAAVNSTSKQSPLLKGVFRVLTGIAISGLGKIAQQSLDRLVGSRRPFNGAPNGVTGNSYEKSI